MAKLSIRDLEAAGALDGSRVLVRVDFNVPFKGDGEERVISDDTRIQGALPTIQCLLDAGAKVILMSHLGRPKGERKEEFSLAPVANYLQGLLEAQGTKVHFCEDAVGEKAEAAAEALQDGEILVLENVRFYAEETANDEAFAGQLAKLADVYVNDAFGTAHRAHASTAGVASKVKQAASGFLMEKELQYLCDELESPKKPFVVIMGGAKVSDKIQVIKALFEKADVFLIGGAMNYTFRLAQGIPVGDSLVEKDKTDLALEILELAKEKNVKFLLPEDGLETQEFKEGAETRATAPYAPGAGVSEGWEGIDIGPKAIEQFCKEIADAGTIVWNGPMGVFEIDSFAQGTKAVAEAMAKCDATTIIGGGDSVTAVKKFGVADQMTFISTGGGASLELLEGKELPGVAALSDK